MERIKNLSIEGTLHVAGTKITASGAEINALAGQSVSAADAAKLHAITTTAAKINQVADAAGSVTFDRLHKVAVVTLNGSAIHAGVTNWQNPESGAILVQRTVADITTKSTAASTLNIGTATASNTTGSDNILDGIDSGTAAATFDSSINTDAGTNGLIKVQKLAQGKWVTFQEGSGNTAAMVGKVYITYLVA